MSIDTIKLLHSLYERLTGYSLRLDSGREHEWWIWIKRGFTPEDLKLVIKHIQKGIADKRRNVGALKFSNLIVSADLFEEDLAEARARGRVPKGNPHREEVLKATGRKEEERGKAKSAKEIMQSPGYQAMVALRKSLQ